MSDDPRSPAALRAKIAQQKAATGDPKPPGEPPPAKVAPPGKAVRYRCGCVTPMAEFEARDCPKHREEKRQERARKKREKADAKKAADPTAGKAEAAGRLPDGARFDVMYFADKMIWLGTLAVGDRVFSGTASGVERLLRELAGQFRQASPGNPGDG